MLTDPWTIIGSLAILGGSVACNKTEMGGSGNVGGATAETKTKGPTVDDPEFPPPLPSPQTRSSSPKNPRQSCLDPKSGQDSSGSPDQVAVDWMRPVKACISQNRMYHFATGECIDLPPAKSFECSWDGVFKALKKIRVVAKDLEKEAEKGAKLVSCAERQEGQIIITQSIIKEDLEKVDCAHPGSMSGRIVTGCFMISNGNPVDLSTQDKVDAYVAQCLKG